MSNKTHFQHYKLKFNNQSLLGINKFLGVDYNPAQLNVANNHAVDIKNIIYKDGVNQKRIGYEQLAQVEAFNYRLRLDNGSYSAEQTNTLHINGVWELVDSDNNKHIIAHIGKILFEINYLGQNTDFTSVKFVPLVEKVSVTVGGVATTYNIALELNDEKSVAFHGLHRLFILGGNKFYVLKMENGRFELKEVEDDSETYVPVTTIGITEIDSAVNEQQVLDDVNLMTQWRRNKCVSGTYVDDGSSLRTTRFTDYSLDTSVVAKKPTDINNIKITISELKEIE